MAVFFYKPLAYSLRVGKMHVNKNFHGLLAPLNDGRHMQVVYRGNCTVNFHREINAALEKTCIG